MNPTPPTFSGPHRPLLVRLLNAAGRGLAALTGPRPRIGLDGLLGRTGLAETLEGPDDQRFLERFRALLGDADGPARLTTVGRIAARRQFVTLLENRVQVRRCLREHPEILQVPLDRPTFVVGQARTGTTLLYNLLAQDPEARAPRLWELARPVPPPDPEAAPNDPRVRELERDLKSLLSVIPAVMTAHALDPRGPEECYHLLETAAFSATFLLYFEIPGYWSRLMASPPQEAREAYTEFRQQIQLLQLHARGRRWVSKAPSHLFFLEALLQAVPEARIVHTHRDPLESIPSLCSLIAIVRSFSSDRVDPAAIGAHTMEWYLEAGRRSESARALAGDRIVDVGYPRLLADPVGTVKEVYQRLGHPFTAAFEGRMRSWLAENPQHKHGVHRYSLEQFGLDPSRVAAATREYRETRLPRA